MLAHCFVLPHLYLNGLFTEREGDIENKTEVGEEEDGSMQWYLMQKKKNEIEGGQRVTKKRKRRKRLWALWLIFLVGRRYGPS